LDLLRVSQSLAQQTFRLFNSFARAFFSLVQLIAYLLLLKLIRNILFQLRYAIFNFFQIIFVHGTSSFLFGSNTTNSLIDLFQNFFRVIGAPKSNELDLEYLRRIYFSVMTSETTTYSTLSSESSNSRSTGDPFIGPLTDPSKLAELED
jgi:hypothetical protein